MKYLESLNSLKMKLNQFDIWIADLNPQIGTETGKTRPVLIIQSNLLNQASHPSTLICPLTTRLSKSTLLRVSLPAQTAGLISASDIMIDQLRAIDNKRLVNYVGSLPSDYHSRIKENLKIVLDLDF